MFTVVVGLDELVPALLLGLRGGGAEHGGHITVAGLSRSLKHKVETNANLDNRS